MINETWLPIEGYPNYEISNLGNVRNCKTGRILKAYKKHGYSIVDLTLDDVIKNLRVHRLVAKAFIPNNDSTKTDVDHINGVKTDNRVENLRWCNFKENNEYYHSKSNNINRGVHRTQTNTYQSEIKINGNRIRKTFKRFEDAVNDYKQKHKAYYGTDCTSEYNESLMLGNLSNDKIPIDKLMIEKSRRVEGKWTVKLGKQNLKHSQLKFLGFNCCFYTFVNFVLREQSQH